MIKVNASIPDPHSEHTDVDIWATDIMIIIGLVFNAEEDCSKFVNEDRTLNQIHDSQSNLLNALRDYYQMHL